MTDAKIRPGLKISPSLVLTHAYLMLLDWSVDERGAYPEVRIRGTNNSRNNVRDFGIWEIS